jgi:hypothetical protein
MSAPRARHSFACLVLIVMGFVVAFAAGAPAQDGIRREPLVIITAAGEHAFEVEIAASDEQQSRGLMFRRSLGDREGMLFVHEPPRFVQMWMRNTYIPLDMIFIRADGRVHRIEASTEPFSERIIESGARVAGVLEVAGGTAAKLGLKPGNRVRHPHFKADGG